MLFGCIDGSLVTGGSKDRDGDMRGTDGKMETEGDREGWLEMNGTDDTNGSIRFVRDGWKHGATVCVGNVGCRGGEL